MFCVCSPKKKTTKKNEKGTTSTKKTFYRGILFDSVEEKNGVCVLVFSLHFATCPPQFSRNEVIKHGNNCAKCNAEFTLRWSCK